MKIVNACLCFCWKTHHIKSQWSVADDGTSADTNHTMLIDTNHTSTGLRTGTTRANINPGTISTHWTLINNNKLLFRKVLQPFRHEMSGPLWQTCSMSEKISGITTNQTKVWTSIKKFSRIWVNPQKSKQNGGDFAEDFKKYFLEFIAFIFDWHCTNLSFYWSNWE